jgi:hypothetical protein
MRAEPEDKVGRYHGYAPPPLHGANVAANGTFIGVGIEDRDVRDSSPSRD